MKYITIFIVMVLLHIIDDFVLQTYSLSKLKQKSYWQKHHNEDKYKYDFQCALFIHATSWSIMTHLPWLYFIYNNQEPRALFVASFIITTSFHYWVDDAKTNQRVINLWIDQMLHFLQLLFILFLMFLDIEVVPNPQ